MTWQAVAAQDESVWTEQYLAEVLSSHARQPLPPATQKIGGVEVFWNEIEPGSFVVHAQGGTFDDRLFVRYIVDSQLRAYGMRPAEFTLGGPSLSKTAAWPDIEAKAQRIRKEPGSLPNGRRIQLLRNGADHVVAMVEGDTDTYQSEFHRVDPNSMALTTWQCECPWDQFAWQRTRQWKPLEGRPCAHVLATWWESQATPLDAEYDPTTGQPVQQINQQGQMSFGTPEMQPTAPRPTRPPATPMPTDPNQQLSIPGIFPGQAEATQPIPPGNNIVPPFPGYPAMPPPVSIPGGKQPSPLNPVQYPGGTFSSVQYPRDLFQWARESATWDFHPDDEVSFYPMDIQKWAGTGDTFENSDMVRLEVEEYGIAEGKSEEHGAGQYRIIPKNSIGEVLGQDPTTGWVDVIFPLHDTGPMEPFHLRAWIDSANLTPMQGIKKPGPFIKRRT